LTSPALEIKGLTKRFGSKTVVNDVSFQVDQGDMFGFLGPNGGDDEIVWWFESQH